jgi:hypothetical protein
MRGVSVLTFVSLLLGLSACAPAGTSAYVSFNIPPDGSCTVTPVVSGGKFIPEGQFDISGKKGDHEFCDTPYYLNLLVNSNLRASKDTTLGRAEPNVLQITSAEVRLMDINHATMTFNKVKPALPNPFLVVANNTLSPSQGGDPSVGIAVVRAIPTDYAHQLVKYAIPVSQEILVEVQLFGTTIGNEDIDFKPFTYPVRICDGCLTRCLASDVMAHGLTPGDIYGTDCPDNAGADGRVCVDPGC